MSRFKPSKPQQRVIDFLLKNEGSYILRTDYYDWQHFVRVISIKQFTREACKITTLNVLIRHNVLEKKGDNENHFHLSKSFLEQNKKNPLEKTKK